MDRRQFIKLISASAIGAIAPDKFPLWNPLPEQVKFLTAQDKLYHALALYGIPYHVSNTTSGAWLGISRGTEIHKEIASLIKLLEEDKMK